MSPSEEIPGVVKLNSPQLGEFVLLIFGPERVVDSGCRKDSSHANGTSNELVILADNGGQDARVENGHGVGNEEGEGIQS